MERLSTVAVVRSGSRASEWDQHTSIALLLGSSLAVLALPFQISVSPRIVGFTLVTLLISIVLSGMAYSNAPLAALLNCWLDTLLRSRWGSRLLVVCIVVGWCIGLLSALTSLHFDENLMIAVYTPLVVFWPLLLAIGLLWRPSAQPVPTFGQNVISVVVAVLLAWLLLEGLLQLAFERLPAQLTATLPQSFVRVQHIQFDPITGAREFPAGQDVNLTINRQYGDLFYLSCLTPSEQETFAPYRVSFTRDAHGFRNPSPWPSPVSLVVTGDSFVAADGVQHPFWEGIQEESLSLGSSGTGSLEQFHLVSRYAIPQQPKVVVIAYFEGNDLGENWEFKTAREHGQTIYDRILSYNHPWQLFVTFNFVGRLRDRLVTRSREACIYPIIDSRGNALAFYDYYLSMATIAKSDLEQSAIFDVTRRAILETAHAVQESGATFVLAFIPSKVHVHWPYLVENGAAETVASQAYALVTSESGLVYDGNVSMNERFERIDRNMSAQADLLRALAEENSCAFLDFTPALQALAGAGVSPYFLSDTHWNQTGHDAAREVLATFLERGDLLP